jgi:intracellular sulfur oxidation DsrE/DsrF family protein
MIRYRAVFHLNEDAEEKVEMVLNNISNLIEDLGSADLEVALVVNGRGVMAMRKDSTHSEKIAQLRGKGIVFKACSRSLERWKMSRESLLEDFDIERSGVGVIVRMQSEGWGYLKP